MTTPASLVRIFKRTTLTILSAMLALSLCACDVHFALAPGSLPTLSGVDALRDEAVRTETALKARAEQLSARATSCPDCQKVLDNTAANGSARIAALGGAWQPWGSSIPEGVQTPAPVPDAPLEPADFAAWMLQTGMDGLQAAAAQTEASGEEAATLAAIAAGRIAGATQLASVYGITLPPVSQDSSGHTADTAALANSDVLAHTVTVWDCAAQTYPHTQAVSGAIEDATLPADHLLTRVAEVLALGVNDQRQLHCSMPSTDPTDLAADVLQADLNVFSSDQPDVRQVAVTYVAEDAQDLAQLLEIGQVPAILGIAQQ